MQQRSQLIDAVRGLVIFLMLWGHSIQYSLPKDIDFFENPVFKFIYSFHMPLFMVISGYLLGLSLKKQSHNSNIKEYAGRRIIDLLQPIIIGGLLNYIIIVIGSLINGSFHNIHRIINIWDIIMQMNNIWFLWSIIGATVSVGISFHLTKTFLTRVALTILFLPIVYILPNSSLNLYMYPIFIIGVLYAFYGADRISLPLKRTFKIVCVISFIVLLFFFEKKHYIYTTGLWSDNYSVAENLSIHLFRWSIGIIGSISVIVFVDSILAFIYKKCPTLITSLSNAGKKSLQIYILSISLLSTYLSTIMSKAFSLFPSIAIWIEKHMLIHSIFFAFIIALIYIFFLFFFTKLLEKVGVAKYIFGR